VLYNKETLEGFIPVTIFATKNYENAENGNRKTKLKNKNIFRKCSTHSSEII
jgi:hypothetical protein